MFFSDMPIDANKMTVSIGSPGGKLQSMGERDQCVWWRVRLTTLAALATTSRSEEREERVQLTAESREEDSRDTSRRHSVARALNIASVMRSELGIR